MDDLIQQMEELIGYGDKEIVHWKADEILCEALERLGQHELVKLFRKVEKWYA